MKAGFVFSMLVDFPNSSKAKKYYMILDAGSTRRPVPKALEIDPNLLLSEENKQDNNDHHENESNMIGLHETWRQKQEKKALKENKQIILQQGVDQIEEQALRSHFIHAPIKKHRKKKRGVDRFMDKDWIVKQKERRMAKGFEVPRTSKFTGRKRKPLF